MSHMLQNLVDETIEEIYSNAREDGLNLPIQAERAARQVLGRHNLSSTLILERLFSEVVRMQEERSVLPHWDKLHSTSLTDFIAKAAKQQMGGEYQHLLHERYETLAPSRDG
jgi:hypothetical protein